MFYRHCITLLFCFKLMSYVIISHAQQTDTLTIFAASSLTDAFVELEHIYETQNPTVDVLFNFAGSSTLAAQINAGAPADIFASANEMQMQALVDAEIIHDDDVLIFATNRLIIALPTENPAHIKSLSDLARDGVLLAFAVPDVPIRVYTDILLEMLNNEFGDDYSSRVLQNVVTEEANVRQVIARVALGEVDAGIVYQTDVVGDMSDQLDLIPIKADINPMATYPIARLFNSPHQELAQTFIDLVQSEEGQMIMRRYGFCSPVIIEDDTNPEVTPEATSEPLDETEDHITACE